MEILQMTPGGTRYGHEFQCIGCDRHVIAFVHHGHARLCLMCQEFGPEMSRGIQDRGEAIPPASRDGEVSLLNAVIRELAAEKMATLAAMRELLSGHDNLYCAHFGATCNPADDIAAKAARRILDEA